MRRLLHRTAFGLALSQVLVVIGSWLYSAARPISGVRSLLSDEGLRWLMGHLCHALATPLLVWLLLSAMAVGCMRQSGIGQHWARRRAYRESRALIFASAVTALYGLFVLLLAVLPRAVLLSATGGLWPSPLGMSLVPVSAFGLTLFSTIYGTVAGRFEGLGDVCDALVEGIRQWAPLLLLYVLAMQLWASLCYVLP